MILVLFLGGYLQPVSQYRLSQQREFVIYQALCRQQNLKAIDANIELVANSISMSYNSADIENKLNSVDSLLKRRQMIELHDIEALQNIYIKKQAAEANGLTGNAATDKLINMYKFLEKHNVIKSETK